MVYSYESGDSSQQWRQQQDIFSTLERHQRSHADWMRTVVWALPPEPLRRAVVGSQDGALAVEARLSVVKRD